MFLHENEESHLVRGVEREWVRQGVDSEIPFFMQFG